MYNKVIHFWQQNQAQMLVLCIVAAIYLLTLKGGIGQGITQAESLAKPGLALADSIGRGRYALVLSLVEQGKTTLSQRLATFAAPDVALSNGHYISIFPPGIAFFVTPFYVMGSWLGMGQLAAQASVMVVAWLNGVLLYGLARKFGFSRPASLLAPVTFLLASNAMVYAGVISQHHVSTLLLLLCVHLMTRKNTMLVVGLTLILASLSVIVDWSNVIILAPVCLTIVFRGLKANIVLLLLALIPILFYGWYNMKTASNPFAIGQLLPRVNSKPMNSTLQKTFFLKKIPQGLAVLLVRPERGVLWYSPLFFVSVLGVVPLWKKQRMFVIVAIATVLAVFGIYSSFGDPWGGPSFGPRYLIPAFALGSLFVTAAFVNMKYLLIKTVFAVIGIISVTISTLGAVTTTLIPTAKEMAKLDLNVPLQVALNQLHYGPLGSFVYTTSLASIISREQFFLLLTLLSNGVFLYAISQVMKEQQL